MNLTKHLSLLCILGASGVAMFADPAMASHILVEDHDVSGGAGDDVEVVLGDDPSSGEIVSMDGEIDEPPRPTPPHLQLRAKFLVNVGMPGSLDLELVNPTNPADALLQAANDLVFMHRVDTSGKHILDFEALSINATGMMTLDPNHPNFQPQSKLTLGAGIQSVSFTFRNVVYPESQVPEPSVLASLMMLGLIGTFFGWRRTTSSHRR